MKTHPKLLERSLLIGALATLPISATAQREHTSVNYWSIGIDGGATLLLGDNKSNGFDDVSWNSNLSVGYVINNSIHLYGNIGYAVLKGSSDNSFTIDECNFLSMNINVGYDVLQLFRNNSHRKIGIVPHWGIGVIQHKTRTIFADGSVIENGYSGSASGINGRRNVFQNVFGLTFTYNISEHFSADIDLSAMKTDTDYLDNVGGADHQKHNDWYSTANIGIAYKFGHLYKSYRKKKNIDSFVCW